MEVEGATLQRVNPLAPPGTLADGGGDAPASPGTAPEQRRSGERLRSPAVPGSAGATETGGQTGPHPGGVRLIRKILVAVGGAISAKSGLPMLEVLARMFQAELILISILPPEAAAPEGRVSPQEAQATAYLEMISARMHAQGIHGHGLLLVASSAADAIVQEARETGADLIALGVSARGRFPLAFQPTVPHDVARRAPCPVLLVRQTEAPTRAPEVRSFALDAAEWGPLSRTHLGVRPVPVARIIGSVGRSGEAATGAKLGNPATSPNEQRQRYQRVLQAMRAGIVLPAVELYKLGSGYYILDGNHRVAAAVELGQTEIDADVTEFIPLGDAAAQRTVAERRAFEHQTGLKEIESAHVPGTFVTLGELVEAFGATVPTNEAVDVARRWYSQEYLPLARAVRERGLLRHYPGEQTADVVARLATFRRHLARGDRRLRRKEGPARQEGGHRPRPFCSAGARAQRPPGTGGALGVGHLRRTHAIRLKVDPTAIAAAIAWPWHGASVGKARRRGALTLPAPTAGRNYYEEGRNRL